MEKNLEVSFLLDFYGDLLTDNQKNLVNYYYNEDLSLSEIAQMQGISRQGVRDTIKKAEANLFDFENRIGFAKKFKNIKLDLKNILNEINSLESKIEKNYDLDSIKTSISVIKVMAEKLL